MRTGLLSMVLIASCFSVMAQDVAPVSKERMVQLTESAVALDSTARRPWKLL